MRAILAAVALVVLALPLPAAAQAGPAPTRRLDMALILESQAASSVALGLTMACTSDGSCRELNPVMAKFIGDGPVPATLVKASINAGATYAVWRFTRGKTRTLTLLALAAINTWDAAHDVRVARRIAARR